MSHAFRAAVEATDLDAMQAALHPDVVFRSPIVHTPYEGRDGTMLILSEVAQVFQDFRYTGELSGDGLHGLVFEARVGDKLIQGWDFLETDADGLVTSLTVMVRPLSATLALAQAMAERLEAAAGREPAPPSA